MSESEAPAPGPERNTKISFAKNRILRRLLLLPFVVVVAMFFLSLTSPRPDNLGTNAGRLAACPESPNCVSTQTDRESHRMQPISYEGSRADVIDKIKSVVLSDFPRAQLITESGEYLHFEFTSLVFRFVDDVEFLVDDKEARIHFRSASRAGHSDLGVNRKRMKLISEKLNP